MSKAKQKIELKAEKRSVVGSKVSKLRDSGLMPAVLYGREQEAISLQVSLKEFESVLKSAGESSLVYINVDGKEYPTLIHDVSHDPIKSTPVHADFYKVRLDEKVHSNVPIVFTDYAPAVKELGGIFIRNVNEIEVEAFPQDLPHEVSVSLSILAGFSDQILLHDINVGEGVEALGDKDRVIATIQEPKSQEQLDAELDEPTTDVSAVEEIKKEKEGEEETEKADAEQAQEEKPKE